MSRPGKSNQPLGPASPPQVARSWGLAWGENDEASSPYPTACTSALLQNYCATGWDPGPPRSRLLPGLDQEMASYTCTKKDLVMARLLKVYSGPHCPAGPIVGPQLST